EEARRMLHDGRRRVTVAKPERFYKKELQYDSYFESLMGHVRDKITPFWLDLKCVTASGSRYPLRKYVDDWLDRSSPNLLALLGDFGTGKTWFAHYYADALARRHAKDAANHRIPILISLRAWRETRSMKA